ncbi:protein kinase [Psychromonas sp. B3M02]|uniref:leucine-rich repeat domain-containing protein n=1 Tax=Psychromonas sp. B3M02 TaxID=2267226 RepID=UPI000DE82940|nr:leucine-rich repeat-containing protein kinase family protein [Psychromonas sp. B3M02]RBW46794.1 protein kinase [Psychromonas sp. B3M02]
MHTLAQLKAGKLIGIKRLQLVESLTEFPMEILTLAESLEILDLSNNQLTSLPKEIAQLRHLKIIFASNNCFTELPEALGDCPKLEMVGFKSNQITQVSAAALPMPLRWLILTDNQISYLPEALGDRPRLQKLALAGNQLKRLPKSTDQLLNLELLRISANQLLAFPIQVLNLPKLAWFAFAGNPFCSTSAETKPSTIQVIDASHYELQEVLGRGASGVIYKAKWVDAANQDNLWPNEIAVKVFKGEVTSDGYPQDELDACLRVGEHHNLVKPIARVVDAEQLALVMELIPPHFKNLGLPPNFDTCTRDTFEAGFELPINTIKTIVEQMQRVFEHLHNNQVCHGDLYAHNTLFDAQGNIIFGDFGAASTYQGLLPMIQETIKEMEERAFIHFIDDLLSICRIEDKENHEYQALKALTFEKVEMC